MVCDRLLWKGMAFVFVLSSTVHQCGSLVEKEEKLDPFMTVPDLIRWWGYPVEEHYVTTPDGYILALHRIPHGKSKDKKKRTPVFLGHCLVGSSAIWTFGPNSLAYLLADRGYDVWMPNARGSSYSKNHTDFDACRNCQQFWEFGFEESALMDYSTSVDYILGQTGAASVYFVGYSMGTTQYLILLSEKPEYNDKFRAGFLMGPAAFGGNFSQPFLLSMAQQAENVEYLLKALSIREFLPNFPEIQSRLATGFCNNPLYSSACVSLFALLMNMNPREIDPALVPLYVRHMPAGSSLKQFVHFAQLFRNGGRFAKYDYGQMQNIVMYGSSEPPEYPVSRISVPTVLFSGKSDLFSSPDDTGRLAVELQDSLWSHHVLEDPEWSHLHYIWSVNAKEVVFDKVIEMMDQKEREEEEEEEEEVP